jgi:type I restriction enzyme, S subunit
MPESPKGWYLSRLDKVAEIGTGVTLGRELSAASSLEYPYLRVANVQDGYIDTRDLKTVRILPSEVARYQLKRGDVLLTEGGDFDKLGRGAIWDGTIDNCLHQNHIFRVRFCDSIIPKFFVAYLTSLAGRAYFLSCAKQTTNLASINKTQLRAMPVPIPSIDEQRRIAEILEILNNDIQNSNSVIDKLSSALDGIKNDLMRNGLNESGRIRHPMLEASQFHCTAAGLTPRAWRVGQLGSFISLKRGFDITVTEQHDGAIPVVSSSGITSYHNKAMVKGPGVVIGRKGKLGDAYYIESDYWPHDTSLWVTDFKGNLPKFVTFFLAWLRLGRFDAATSVPTLNRNFIHPLAVAIPDFAEQIRVVKVIEAWEARLLRERRTVAKLQTVKQGLTEDLLTGRVRVIGGSGQMGAG